MPWPKGKAKGKGKGKGERRKAKGEREKGKGKGERGRADMGDGFEDLLVWQKSMELVVKVYERCRQGGLSKDWGLRDQLQRAAVSVPANIAEGYERGSRKEYIQFLVIAKGSAGELRCLIQIACRLRLIDDATADTLINNSMEVSRMLKGLINSLRS